MRITVTFFDGRGWRAKCGKCESWSGSSGEAIQYLLEDNPSLGVQVVRRAPPKKVKSAK